MNQIVFAAGVLLFPAVCTTLGAAGVFLLRRSAAPRTQRVLSGMAAGIMLAVTAVIFYKHRENLHRILHGGEVGLRSTLKGEHRLPKN